ncbi:ExbD/TolR family protein [Coraliomargarita parva]|uniref:ExbD/TolR family protein n=1 Tax=Coraliomargarita parva TaxID=3014050 RepID=UPI0022B53BAF|nr:biopolymer transporter ExbD [Coraliomargarita parva]
MKAWQPDDVDPEFELTPMIDVVFLLIAFFMTLISFISAELIKLELPEAEQATIPEEPGERQYISVDINGEVYFGAKPTTYETLPAALVQMRTEQPGLKVYLRADSAVPHRYVNRVMEACAKAGIFDLIFASNKD